MTFRLKYWYLLFFLAFYFPFLRQDCVFELISKRTTHTYVEERQVLRMYIQTTQLLSGIFGVLRLKRLKRSIAATEQVARDMVKRMSELSSLNTSNRSLMT